MNGGILDYFEKRINAPSISRCINLTILTLKKVLGVNADLRFMLIFHNLTLRRWIIISIIWDSKIEEVLQINNTTIFFANADLKFSGECIGLLPHLQITGNWKPIKCHIKAEVKIQNYILVQGIGVKWARYFNPSCLKEVFLALYCENWWHQMLTTSRA